MARKSGRKKSRTMPPVKPERDLRLDLFRGIALWLIFLDHIPSNAVSWITSRNYGFSDATEIFVFISGYTAAFVYGRAMRQHGFVVASARVLKRAWQVYIAHVFLLAIYLAEIAYVASSFDNPLYTEEMGVLDFLKNPDVTIFQALLLKFKPVNMDVLPLYILLLAWFPPMLWLLLRAPSTALISSAFLYVLMWFFEWNLPAWPSGTWVFNPFAWQLLFVFGAWCALGGAQNLSRWINSRFVLGLAIAYLVFAFCIAMTWYFPRLAVYVPKFVGEAIYPIDKTNLDVLRILHFLSLAVITVALVPSDWPALKSRIFWPAIVCGQHSLETFCLGVFLSFAGHFMFTEVSNRLFMHVAVSVAGIAIMVAIAAMLSWYKQEERQSGGRRMSWRVLLLALLVLAGPAWAELPAECGVAAYLVETSYPLPKVKRAIAEKKLNILVVGAGSSQLPGANGEKNAYPARLQQALVDQLKGVEVKVTTDIKATRTAAEMVKALPPNLAAAKPSLMIWQTGTTDAMRAVDPDQFSQALDQGINIARGASADVILVNAQYSPRTESMIALSTYSEDMRWVALQQEVPLFDRFSIMRLWSDLGTFDLYSAPKKLDIAERVHDCIGRLLADLVIAAAKPEEAPTNGSR